MTVVVDDVDPRRLVDVVTGTLDAGRAVAVLDGRWPPGLLAAARDELRRHGGDLAPQDLVVFTSGTAGRPLAVHRSLASWQASAAALSALIELRADDVTWLPGHPASTLSLYAAWHALQAGSTIRVAGEQTSAATIVHAVPSLVPGILAARVAGELPALRVLVTAGDRVPGWLRSRCAELGLRLVAYYGAAELSFVGVADDDACGYRAFPGVELDIRDGVLWSRSSFQAYGYLGGRVGGDRDRCGPLQRTAEGWACVGDRACWAGPGRVDILGRADEAVIVAGHTILIADVEDALRAQAGVEDVVVVGLPDRVHGHRLAALWVGAPSDPEAFEGRAVETSPLRGSAVTAVLPVAARPRYWIRVPQLPRTAAGKIDRAAALALAVQQTGRVSASDKAQERGSDEPPESAADAVPQPAAVQR